MASSSKPSCEQWEFVWLRNTPVPTACLISTFFQQPYKRAKWKVWVRAEKQYKNENTGMGPEKL